MSKIKQYPLILTNTFINNMPISLNPIPTKMLSQQLKDIFLKNKDNLADILGQDAAKQAIKSALLTNRHIIIVGPPGIGKTTIAKNLAKLLPSIEVIENCDYHCTPQNPVCPFCKQKEKAKNLILQLTNLSTIGKGSRNSSIILPP